jgi:hypothetical protein
MKNIPFIIITVIINNRYYCVVLKGLLFLRNAELIVWGRPVYTGFNNILPSTPRTHKSFLTLNIQKQNILRLGFLFPHA